MTAAYERVRSSRWKKEQELRWMALLGKISSPSGRTFRCIVEVDAPRVNVPVIEKKVVGIWEFRSIPPLSEQIA